MKTSTLRLFFIDALKSIKRNKTLSTVSSATVAATLFILGILFLILLNVRSGIGDVESQIQVQVYLKNDITIDQQTAILSKITSTSGITNVQFESKDEAFQKFKKQLGNKNKSLVDGLDASTTMPSSYIISLASPTYSSVVVKALESNGTPIPGIDKINDGRELVNKIISITNTIKWVGIVIFLILIGVSLFLIGNTIKLAVYSRRREIGIMKYIGATDWFIRLPFVIEGMILGFIGSIVSTVIVYYVYTIFYSKVSSSFMMSSLISSSYVWTSMSWEFILAGMFIGALGSILSIRKFLEV
ncbi:MULTISPECIES: permease-like cell division protein FtsX [Clostridium]|uniref:permease-like cell division protein FtsX n=1 Tax=Clostridium TaxID=1485 RepID=UPI00069FD76B|nr:MULTISPECIES: permease-like cell division protein FtsX [Clostridium]KOF55798.1 cell division protein FtsX [Clostridium sp. DMHC 10]MCD2346325.1 permease-like cell division protein FtsX [Clostridium guangxiense]